jgi:hypothetical protein
MHGKRNRRTKHWTEVLDRRALTWKHFLLALGQCERYATNFILSLIPTRGNSMSDDVNRLQGQHTVTSAQIALAAGLVSSTLFLMAASFVAVGLLIASTQSIGAIKEGSDDSVRVLFWYFLSLMNVIVFYFFGITGLVKTMRGYKEFSRLTKQT